MEKKILIELERYASTWKRLTKYFPTLEIHLRGMRISTMFVGIEIVG